MEELLELKQLLRDGEVETALVLVEDLEEMGRKGIARNIRSYTKVLLLHLIKQKIEQRTTKSWDASIRNAIREIQDLNARPKGKGVYLTDEELTDTINSAWDSAVDLVAVEASLGSCNSQQIEQMVNKTDLIEQALVLVTSYD